MNAARECDSVRLSFHVVPKLLRHVTRGAPVIVITLIRKEFFKKDMQHTEILTVPAKPVLK